MPLGKKRRSRLDAETQTGFRVTDLLALEAGADLDALLDRNILEIGLSDAVHHTQRSLHSQGSTPARSLSYGMLFER
ncbi:hypothetical protein QYM36_013937 [Artemia franciscana]|uniref:Uncharacterized protein n=1 Tax=Artemia franciscana TaxID=6661 RepID=A0AA88L0G2_ARTSF|nr:hypothetical protein QYM36_013937 [Artemia franciscana]